MPAESEGWHALTIGKGVVFRVDQHSHALPDGQGVPPTALTSPELRSPIPP